MVKVNKGNLKVQGPVDVQHYDYLNVTKLKTGQYFMFVNGQTLNRVVTSERNFIIYQNIITLKFRKLRGFLPDNKSDVCGVRYCKIIDRVFEQYHENKMFIKNCPF